MTTITREQQKQILIDTANHVISRDNTSPYSENLRELARIALASLESEPIGAFHIADQQVGGTSDYIKDGEWPIDNGVIEVYAAPPASEREQIRREHAEWSYADPVVFTDERNLRHIASGRETSLIWGKQNQEVGDIPLYRHAQPVPVDKEFIPKNLDKALGVVGVALPESKEEFNFQIERWIQRLIDRVIRYADEFKEQPVPVVPEEMNFSTACNFVQINGMAKEDRATLAMRAWNACRAAMLNGGKS
ncbi:Eaa protein [Salmonella enterica]|nr:Eaa protein [Salmonella enterica]EAW9405616.1 Eaa protein [Salmonella enterica]EAW9415061.1 Eaa protein [Salmonella enterica]EED8493368.1 Eaa protein [Salmonella enterica subsp. enterica]